MFCPSESLGHHVEAFCFDLQCKLTLKTQVVGATVRDAIRNERLRQMSQTWSDVGQFKNLRFLFWCSLSFNRLLGRNLNICLGDICEFCFTYLLIENQNLAKLTSHQSMTYPSYFTNTFFVRGRKVIPTYLLVKL